MVVLEFRCLVGEVLGLVIIFSGFKFIFLNVIEVEVVEVVVFMV